MQLPLIRMYSSAQPSRARTAVDIATNNPIASTAPQKSGFAQKVATF